MSAENRTNRPTLLSAVLMSFVKHIKKFVEKDNISNALAGSAQSLECVVMFSLVRPSSDFRVIPSRGPIFVAHRRERGTQRTASRSTPPPRTVLYAKAQKNRCPDRGSGKVRGRLTAPVLEMLSFSTNFFSKSYLFRRTPFGDRLVLFSADIF